VRVSLETLARATALEGFASVGLDCRTDNMSYEQLIQFASDALAVASFEA